MKNKLTKWEAVTLSLAGIFQSALLVRELARKGEIDQTIFENMINSILKINADSVLEIYNGVEGVKIGLKALPNLLSKKTAAIIAPNIYGNLCDSIYIEAYYPHIKIIYDSKNYLIPFFHYINNICQTLKFVPLLAKLNDNEHKKLASLLYERVFAENQKICKQGDEGHEFYIIKSGKCKGEICDEEGNAVNNFILEPGGNIYT